MMPKWILAVAAVLALGLASGEPGVYHGRKEGARNPSEIVAQQVFDRIPEWREIRRRGLGEDDPEYWILLERANQKFYRAVRVVAQQRRRDCIVEAGTHEFGSIPNDTQAVIEALDR